MVTLPADQLHHNAPENAASQILSLLGNFWRFEIWIFILFKADGFIWSKKIFENDPEFVILKDTSMLLVAQPLTK